MDKNTLLKIIKYNYINQFKSLNYNLKNSYPVTWNKDLFTESIKDINFKNIELIKDQYINAIISSLNLDDINNTTYDDAINNLLRSTNININELEYILKEYIDENKDNLDNLQPVNALNNPNLMSKLDMLHNGYYILNGSNNSNQSLLLKRAAYIVADARGDIDRETVDAARVEALRLAAEAEEANRVRLAAEAEVRAAAEEAARIEAAEEAARAEAARLAAVEVARLAAEEAARVEAARVEAVRLAVEEAARVEAARLAAEEAARVEASRLAAQEAARIAEEEAARAEAARKAMEEVAKAEAARLAVEEAARVKAVEEAARIEAARLAAEEAARIKAATEQAARVEAARLAAEETARIEAERLAVEEAERIKAARLAAEEAARIEASRLAAEEAARIAAEEAARAEAARIAAEEVARLAAEEAAKLSAEKVVKLAKQKATKAEAARLAAEKAVRLATAKAAKLAEEEAARLAAEEAARIKAARLAAEEAARIEAVRLEAARVEAARLAAEEVARIEAARLAAEEAARVEAARLAAEEAARIEAAEAARLVAEAARAARLEAVRLAAERAVAAAAEQARVKREAAAAAERVRVEREAVAEQARVQWEAKAAAAAEAIAAAQARARAKAAEDKRRIAEAAAKAAAFHEQMSDASVRLKNIGKISNDQYQLNLGNIKSLQPSYLNLIRNIKVAITRDEDIKQEVTSEYDKINRVGILPINVESELKDILRVLIQNPSDDLIDQIYRDITKQKIGKYKITPNSFIKQDEFQTLLEEIKEIYIKNTNLLNEFEKFKRIIQSLVDILPELYDLKQLVIYLNTQIEDESKIKEKYELYLEDIKSTYGELNKYLTKNKLYLNADLKQILPSFQKAMSQGAYPTYSLILELVAHFKVVPSAMGLKPIYKEVNHILTEMESTYKKKYENIKDDLIVFPHNLDELKQSKLDMIKQISDTVDSHNAECDEIFRKFLDMKGGNSANKELLYNAVAAFLIQNSNQKNFKSLLISLISNNIKIKNNKINIVLPKMNEILKIISLPLYCTDKGINVKYSTMQKCVKNNIHKYVDNDNTNKYLKELNLNSNDKLLAKEFDYRINQIQKIINKK